MSSSSKPLPLKRRRPRISAELEAAAAVRDWSPLEVYWDPRYGRYFYAGTMPTTPGQDEKTQAGDVEVSPGSYENHSGAPSILSSRRSRRKRRRSRISWTMDSASDMSSDFSTLEYDRRRSESFWAVWVLAMLIMMLFIITALFILWLWSYLQDNDGPVRRDAFSGINHRIESSSPREPSKAATRESRPKGAARSFGHATNDANVGRKRSKVARRRYSTGELSGSTCLHTQRNVAANNYDILGEESLPSGSEMCDFLIECCYILEDDMTLQSEMARARTRKYTSLHHGQGMSEADDRQQPRLLLAVRDRHSSLQRLLATGGQRARDEFARNSLLLARSEGYSGLRLWWRDSYGNRVVASGFLRAVKHVAVVLRKARRTLGFFLPYPAGHAQPSRYATTLRALDKILDSEASLVLYPTTSVLGSGSRWPSPSRMVGVSDEASGPNESSSSRSFCHLFLPVTAVSVAIANASVSCDANAIQRVSTSRSFLSDARLSMLCRSWDPSSWKVSWHRYHSYACGFGTRGKAGIVYQTPEQALRHRRELLTLTHSTCFGFLGGHRTFPRECREILPLFAGR